MFITRETGSEYVFQNPSTELVLNVWFPNNRWSTKENLEPDTNGTYVEQLQQYFIVNMKTKLSI